MRVLLSIAVGIAVLACPGPGAPRRIEDPQRGIRYEVPGDWRAFPGELSSLENSTLVFEVFSLVGADRQFVAGLPESIVPQLVEWARSRYVFDGEIGREAVTVAGEPALEIRYALRIRERDAAATLIYWVVRHRDRLYLLRAVLGSGAPPEDEPALRGIVGSLGFIE